MRLVMLALPLLIAGGCDDQSSAGEDGSSDAVIKPGEWRYDQELVELSSPGMSASYIERLTQKANAEVHRQCITAEDANKISAVTGEMKLNCQYDNLEIGGGEVDSTMQCQDREISQHTVIRGSYSAEESDVTATSTVSGSPNPIANAEWVMRIKGTRVGDCAS